MEATQKRELQAFRRIDGYLDAQTDLLTANPALAKQHEALKASVSTIEEGAADQDAGTKLIRLDVTNALELRKELRTHQMQPIVQAARALKKDVPGITVLRMPVSGKRDVQQLLAAADAMAEKAKGFNDVLVQHGMPSTFLDTLTAATAAVRANLDARGAAKAELVKSTKTVASGVVDGRKSVNLIDAVLRPLFKNDPAKLAEWKNVRRVTLKGVIPAPAPAAPTTTAQQTTPTPSAQGTAQEAKVA